MPKSLKIVTLNVWHFNIERVARAVRIGREIKRLEADVVLLQEVPFETREGESEFLEIIRQEAGMKISHEGIFAEVKDRQGYIYYDGIATLSNLPVIEQGIAHQLPGEEVHQSSYVVFNDEEQFFTVFNVHGIWGGHLAHKRESQFKSISTHASILEEHYSGNGIFTVLGGDFNTEPDSSVMRYLKGLQGLGESGAYWIDAWELCGEGEGTTSTPHMKLFSETAKSIGNQYPQDTPERRIDYIMTKGWLYGRRGMPLSIDLCFTEEDKNGYTVSDHYGLVARIKK